MKPKLQRVEVQAVRRRDHDFAVDDRVRREQAKTGVMQIGEVAIERAQVAALNEDIRFATKDNRAKAVPFRFIQETAAGRKRFGKLGQHRLDRRRDRKSFGHLSGASWHFACSTNRRHMTPEVRNMMAVGAPRRWSRGKLSRARRRRVRVNLLAWLRRRHVWLQRSPFGRPPLAA